MFPIRVVAVILVFGSLSAAQAPSRNERRENVVRTEYLKLTADLHVPVITPEKLKKELDDPNLVLVDVRQPAEQKVSMLPHAFTTFQFAQRFHYGFPKDKHIVTYCTIGNRAGKYAEELLAKGLPVQNLEYGLLGWTHVEGPLVTRDSAGAWVPTKKVHVFSQDMHNWIALDYQAVW